MLRHIKHQRGGIGTYTTNLLKNIFEIDKHNEYILLYKMKEPPMLYVNYPNIEEVCIPTGPKLYWDQIAVPIKAREKHLDLIFNPKLSVPIFSSCKKVFMMAGGDWFVFPHNYTWPDRIYHNIFASLYCKRANGIISISESATDDIVRHVNVNLNKIKTIYLGVGNHFRQIDDKAKLDGIKQKYDLPNDFMLFVGQIYPMKNFSGIIKAFSILTKKLPFKLIVVGKPALKYKKEIDLIPRLNLENDVSLIGWIPDEDLPALYNLSTFLVFPSLYEGFGIPIIEAMRCGCPVLTSNRGAPSEVAGDAALLVDPTDIDSIVNGMYELIVNKELRENLIKKGFVRSRKFTWDSCAKKTIALFESLNNRTK